MTERDGWTLAEAIEWLEERKRDGAKCPCCQQFAKVYRRKLTSGMARDLIRLYRLGGADDFVKVPRALNNSDLAKLRFWGLVQLGETTTYYKVTERGVDFLLRRTKADRHILLYNNSFLGSEGDEQTDIIDALGDHFDYDELMGS